ncbi:SGNH/GDSL hydrolase family protein [Actinoplanes sp. NPDC049548]|uniref:SGNH/GDSL hydrolase family protein n=1 Tax=Actinoplanes sp. NPDC049548 TaxID=3155152 RepID=UPI0034401A57
MTSPMALFRRVRRVVAHGLAGTLMVTAWPCTDGTFPDSMVALGDSITRGFNACEQFVDCVARSFGTGTDPAVRSQYLRLQEKNPEIKGHADNLAASGARAADMPAQAATAASRGAQYVTLLVGANDACAPTEAAMTPVATYRRHIDDALATLRSGLPSARIELISIPDLYRLWSIGHDDPSAVAAWRRYDTCPSMLADPDSEAPPDQARRQRVRQRIIDFNTELAEACAKQGPHCVFDGNAVFDYPLQLSHLSTWDYFHPGPAGQAMLADVSYRAMFGR